MQGINLDTLHMAHYEYMALARKTPVLPEAVVIIIIIIIIMIMNIIVVIIIIIRIQVNVHRTSRR